MCRLRLHEDELKRTFLLKDSKIVYCNSAGCSDYKQFETGTPDYSDLKLDQYISAIEIVNPCIVYGVMGGGTNLRWLMAVIGVNALFATFHWTISNFMNLSLRHFWWIGWRK
jgi:hypothetical protein